MRYRALALQFAHMAIGMALDAVASRKLMMESIDRLDRQLGASKAFIGNDLRLVVLPEYFLTGYPMGATFGAWRTKACLDVDGEEYAALGEVAGDHDVYLSGNAYETDEHFADLYFQTSFVIDPSSTWCSDTGDSTRSTRLRRTTCGTSTSR